MRRLSVFLALFLAACGSAPYGERFALQQLALSPDGAIIAVQFADRELRKGGLGLFDRRKGRFTPIPNLAKGRYYIDPSFAPDGKRLVAVSGNQLVTIDLATLAVTEVTHGGQGFKESPVFHPSENKILYVATNPARLQLLDLGSGEETTLLDAGESFGSISHPIFGGSDRVIFLATAPRDPDLYSQAGQMPDSRPDSDIHFYGLRFGAKPELILKNLWALRKSESRWFTGEHAMQASKDGRRIVFIDRASGEGENSQELFTIDNGALKQLTHLHGAVNAAAIAYDGSLAALSADPKRSGNNDLYLIDMDSGNIHVSGLLREIRPAAE